MKKIVSACVLVITAFSTMYAQISKKITLEDKLYGLSNFWSEANYNFVYMYKVDKNLWNKAYKEAITNVQKSANDYEYYRELQKLCALLKDGHTVINLPDDIQNLIMTTQFGDYRLFLTNIGGKVFVYDVNKSKEKEIPLGSEIVKVNGLSTKEYQDTYVKPYISTSTLHSLSNKAAFSMLAGLEGEKYDIQLRTPDGISKNISVTHAKTTETELASVPLQRNIFEFKWLKDKTAYVAVRAFDKASVVQEFEAVIPELKKAGKIIIDIRDNPGGSSKNALNIAQYFISGNSVYGAKNYSREIIPTDRAIGSFLTEKDTISGKQDWGLSKEDATQFFKSYQGSRFHEYESKPVAISSGTKFTVPTVVLTNNYTASAAEDFLIYLNNEKNIIRLGEYTNGSTGQPLQIELPGNATAWICTKKVTFPDGKEFVGIGIAPQIIVPKTLEDVLFPSRHDSQLSAAEKYLKTRNK